MKTIFLPSGDQVGARAIEPCLVSCFGLEPSQSITHSSGPPARSEMKAIRERNGPGRPVKTWTRSLARVWATTGDGVDSGPVSFGERELARHQVDQSRLDHQLAAGAHHGAAEQELRADGPPPLVEDLRSRVVLDQGVEPWVDHRDRRRGAEIVVESRLEFRGGFGRCPRQHHQRRRCDCYPAQPGLGDLEVELVLGERGQRPESLSLCKACKLSGNFENVIIFYSAKLR